MSSTCFTKGMCAVCLQPLGHHTFYCTSYRFKMHSWCFEKFRSSNLCNFHNCNGRMNNIELVLHPWSPQIHTVFTSETQTTIITLLKCHVTKQRNILQRLPKDILYLLCAHIAAHQFALPTTNGLFYYECSVKRCGSQRNCKLCGDLIAIVGGTCSSLVCKNPKGQLQYRLNSAKAVLESARENLTRAHEKLITAAKKVDEAQFALDNFVH